MTVMVFHYSDDLLQLADPNGGKYGDWVLKKDSANITCRFCLTNVRLSEGVKALSKHSGTTKHKKAHSARSLTATIQRSFSVQVDKLKETRTIEAQARDAEIIYLHHVEAHGIPQHAAGCAGELFQQMFPDSKIAAKMTFSESKQGYEITHGLGPYYQTQLVERLRREFFSVNIHRSEDHSTGINCAPVCGIIIALKGVFLENITKQSTSLQRMQTP